MHTGRSTWLLVHVGGIALLVLLTYCATKITVFSDSFEHFLENTEMTQTGDPYETTWTTTASNGGTLTHTVTTTPEEGESEAETAARHKRRVSALEAVYPPEN